jgi:hypothetical protein
MRKQTKNLVHITGGTNIGLVAGNSVLQISAMDEHTSTSKNTAANALDTLSLLEIE